MPADDTQPPDPTENHAKDRGQTLTDLLDELDRAAFHRALALRDVAPSRRDTSGSDE